MLRQRQAIAAATTIEELTAAYAKRPTLAPEEKFILGMHKKVVDKLTTKAKPKPDTGERLFDVVGQICEVWKESATADLRQLPDPVLVALGESLESSPYTREFFRSKLEVLVNNYREIKKVGEVTLEHMEALVPVRVQHPSGATRIGLAYPATKEIPSGAGKFGAEPGEATMTVRDGNYHFHKWVDRSLIGIVPNLDKSPKLQSNDSRWCETPKDLSRWHANPRDTDDVNVLETEKNPFLPNVRS
jgi:hypothetical protein